MNGVLYHDSALLRLYWADANLGNKMNFVMNHAPIAGSITRPAGVGQQSNALPLYHGCLPTNKKTRSYNGSHFIIPQSWLTFINASVTKLLS